MNAGSPEPDGGSSVKTTEPRKASTSAGPRPEVRYVLTPTPLPPG